MLRRLLLATFCSTFLVVGLSAQTQGHVDAQAHSNAQNTATVTSPANGTQITVTKVEQRTVGGGYVDITDKITIHGSPGQVVKIDFKENVRDLEFRFHFKSDKTLNTDPKVDFP